MEQIKIIKAKEKILSLGGEKIVLVGSRRTDLPAFYSDYIIQGLKNKKYLICTPMHPKYWLEFSEMDIHSIGLWSQDFNNWIHNINCINNISIKNNYNFWYRFTINPDIKLLKPIAPSVENQLIQIKKLSEIHKRIDNIFIYLDPLIIFKLNNKNQWENNFSYDLLYPIFKGVKESGIDTITIAIVDYYKHIEKRLNNSNLKFKFLNSKNVEDQNEILKIGEQIIEIANLFKLKIKSCCENLLNINTKIEKGSCVYGSYLNKIFGYGASEKKDNAQRSECNCTKSIDIGSYQMKCYHFCPQCYAQKSIYIKDIY